MEKMDITAVIPVREGSRRLKNKNVAPFAGTNLLLNKIEQLKKVDEISRIVVSSDSDMMLSMAKSAGALTHKRAPEYCDEKTKTFGEVVRHVAESVGGEHILWATCTENPCARAMQNPPHSQVEVDTRPMEAASAAPRLPTMEASINCSSTEASCARMAGPLRRSVRDTRSDRDRAAPLRILPRRISFLLIHRPLFFYCRGCSLPFHIRQRYSICVIFFAVIPVRDRNKAIAVDIVGVGYDHKRGRVDAADALLTGRSLTLIDHGHNEFLVVVGI